MPTSVALGNHFETFVRDHLRIGIASLKQLINEGLTVKHLKF